MTTIEFVAMILGCQRLTSLWFEEIARPLRDRVIRRGGRLAYLARCPLCVSMWSAIAVVALWASPAHILVYVLGVSGGVICFDRVLSFPAADAIRSLAMAVREIGVVKEPDK